MLQSLPAGVAAWWATGARRSGALCAALVVSHLPLDYLAGTRLPLWAGGPMAGLGLYQRPILDVVAESSLVIIGWLLYRSAVLGEPGATRRWPLGILLAALVLIQLGAAFSMGG